MKKIIFLTLSLAFFISCTNDNTVETVEVNSIDQQKYAELFEDYNFFKVDGETVTNKEQIIKSLLNAQVTRYNPESKEVNFYTSNQKHEELTDISSDEDISDIGSEEDVINTEDLTLSEEGIYEYIDPTETENTSGSRDSVDDISGLDNIASDSYYTNFANSVFFISKYSSSTYFTKAKTRSNLSVFVKSAKVTSSRVSKSSRNISSIFASLYKGDLELIIHNDANRAKNLYFYEKTSYGGKSVYIYLGKDKYKTISRYKFGGFQKDRPKSMHVWNN